MGAGPFFESSRDSSFSAIPANPQQFHFMAFQGETVLFANFQLIFFDERVFEFYGCSTTRADQVVMVPDMKRAFIGFPAILK